MGQEIKIRYTVCLIVRDTVLDGVASQGLVENMIIWINNKNSADEPHWSFGERGLLTEHQVQSP